MYQKPRCLEKGNTIGVVSPASRPVDANRLRKGIKYLERSGFNVVVGENVFSQYGYLAGTDKERAHDLNQMFADPAIDAIFCSRGGYGCSRLLHLLDYEAIRDHPKILVGYSDITILQQALLRKSNLISFSGPMVAVEMANKIDSLTEEHFWSILAGTQKNLSSKIESPVYVLSPGVAEGPIIAGCLSVLVSAIGTPYLADCNNAILVLEEIAEEPYSIDRKLCQLKMTGIFDQLQGIVLGQFVSCEPKNPEKPSLSLNQVIFAHLGNLPIPVIIDYPYGHGAAKYTLPVGAKAHLDTFARTFELAEETVLVS